MSGTSGKRTTTDISRDAHSLARMVDRLPCGETVVIIRKPPKPEQWTITVAQVVQKKDVKRP
jgi:hypothetical protein